MANGDQLIEWGIVNMADTILFFQQGWKNAWTHKIIWLFSALPLISQFLTTSQNERDLSFSRVSLFLLESLAFLILYIASLIGVPYLAYRFSTGESPTIQETLIAIRKLFARTLGCSCLGILVLSPVLFIVFSVSINTSTQLIGIPDKIFLSFIPLTIFAAFWQFILFGFIANDYHIRQSIKEAWSIFRSHFGTLALIGAAMGIIIWITSIISGAFTVLMQSGFNPTALSQIDYINPATLLSHNKLYVSLNGVCQIILRAIETFVYVSAYIKYRDQSLRITQTA